MQVRQAVLIDTGKIAVYFAYVFTDGDTITETFEILYSSFYS
jgi:hypothetical protein